jgi:hypothetical protein
MMIPLIREHYQYIPGKQVLTAENKQTNYRAHSFGGFHHCTGDFLPEGMDFCDHFIMIIITVCRDRAPKNLRQGRGEFNLQSSRAEN